MRPSRPPAPAATELAATAQGEQAAVLQRPFDGVLHQLQRLQIAGLRGLGGEADGGVAQEGREPIRISRAEAGECSTTPETTGGEALRPAIPSSLGIGIGDIGVVGGLIGVRGGALPCRRASAGSAATATADR
jgi:hypothetical protein